MRAATAAFLAVVVAGCSRDLEVPPANRLAFVQPVRTAAPRQLLADLQVTGGAGGYRYAFADGGRLSGDDATVDPATGAYRAGARGAAQDLVQVTDGSGSTATVRISVGPPLSVSPPIGGTAPGGQLAFTVSGGLRPYTVVVARDRSGAAVAGTADTILYTAGATGAVIDGLRVTDATLDPAAVATVEISVGVALDAFPSARVVAPWDSATVVGTGGAPPYTYRVKTKGSGVLANITAAGLYTAGGTGDVLDEIEVRDANGETASFFMRVGPPLALALEGAPPDPRPGVPVGLVASGGKPPYTYRFARGGNRSGGTVAAATGTYVPGEATGAVDLFEVTDQTPRALATLSNPTPVGAVRLATGSLNRVCASGDLDGDGVDDLLVANDGFTRLGVMRRIPTGSPRFDSYPMIHTDGTTRFLAVEDVNGDGRAEVFLATAGGALQALFPDALGQLVAQPPFTFPGPGQPALWVTVHDPFYGTYFGSSDGDGRLSAVRWDTGATTAGWMTLGPLAPGYPGGNVLALASGDLDGDGWPDLAFLRGGDASDGNLYVAYGNPLGDFDAVTVATAIVPVNHTFPAVRDWGTPQARLLAISALAGPPDHVGGVLLRVEDAAGRGAVVTARVDPATRAWTVNGPYDPAPDRPGPWGFVAVPRSPLVGADTLYVGYDLVDGNLLGLVLDRNGLLPTAVAVAPGPRASRIDCVAFPDANADGAADLVAVGQFMQTSDLLLGSGDATVSRPVSAPWFGGRVHRRGPGFPAAVADVDGDGLADLLAWDGTGLTVYVGGDGQLGTLQQLTTQLVFGIAASPLFAPEVAGTAVVFHDHQRGFYAALPNGKGGFDPPYALTVARPGGADYLGQVFGLQPVVAGGPALLSQGALFLPRGPGRLLAVPVPAHPTGISEEACTVVSAGAQPDPAGAATVIMACAEPQGAGGPACDLAIYRAAATGLGGPAPSFGGWEEIDRQSNPSPSAEVVVANTFFGTPQLPDGRPVVVAVDGSAHQVRIVTFEPGLVPTTQAITRPRLTASKTNLAALAVTLRPGAADDLFLMTDAAALLLRKLPGGSYAVVEELTGGLQRPVGAGLLDPARPPALITVGAGLFSGDAGTEVVPLQATAAGLLP